MKFIYTLRSSNGTYRSEIIKTTWRTSQVQWHLQVHKEPGHRFLLGRSIPQLQTGRSDLDGSEDHWGKTLSGRSLFGYPHNDPIKQGAARCLKMCHLYRKMKQKSKSWPQPTYKRAKGPAGCSYHPSCSGATKSRINFSPSSKPLA